MSNKEMLITILVMALATQITRFLPFILFSDENRTPKFITYLGEVLPPAIFGMLVIYCLKDVSLTSNTFGIAEAIALLVTYLMHKYKKQMLLSIMSGTICYMLLVNLFF